LLRTLGRWTRRALPFAQAAIDDVGAAEHDDLVAARRQAAGELLGGRLEAAVGRGDPARAEDGDLHLPMASA
jgi:hypothetical protein